MEGGVEGCFRGPRIYLPPYSELFSGELVVYRGDM